MVPNNKRNETNQHIKRSGNDKPESFWQGYARTRRSSSSSRLVAWLLIAAIVVMCAIGVVIAVGGTSAENERLFSEVDGYSHYYEGEGDAISLSQYLRMRGYYPQGTRERYVYYRDTGHNLAITIRVDDNYCTIGDASGEVGRYPVGHHDCQCRISRIYERDEDKISDHPGVDFIMIPKRAIVQIAKLVEAQKGGDGYGAHASQR